MAATSASAPPASSTLPIRLILGQTAIDIDLVAADAFNKQGLQTVTDPNEATATPHAGRPGRVAAASPASPTGWNR